jgi:CheY-like chemotaxis protein
MDEGPSILVVDSNVGFAAMLEQGLEQAGDYSVTVAHDGQQALAAAAEGTFGLAIVDLGLHVVNDLDGATVARKLREGQSDLRLMLIPVRGDTLSEEVADLDVQGILPKPFFLPDLADLLHVAMTRPVRVVEAPVETDVAEPVEAPPEPPAPAEPRVAEEPAVPGEPPPVPRECSPAVLREMEDLALQTRAAAVLLTHGEEVLGSVGPLSPDAVGRLARIVAESARISSQVREILGGERRHFEQSMEGDAQMLYSLTVVGDVILSAALRGDAALGMVRHQVRTAVKRVRDLMP